MLEIFIMIRGTLNRYKDVEFLLQKGVKNCACFCLIPFTYRCPSKRCPRRRLGDSVTIQDVSI